MERKLQAPGYKQTYANKRALKELQRALSAVSLVPNVPMQNVNVNLEPMNAGVITITADIKLPSPIDYIAHSFRIEPA